MHSVVAAGHELAVADLVTELGRDRYHGLDDITAAVKAFGANTAAFEARCSADASRHR